MRCWWVCITRCSSADGACRDSDPKAEQGPKRRQGAGDDANSLFRQGPKPDSLCDIYELARVTVECKVLQTNNGCARRTNS
jgi:hypothetical protein